jgi:hypothetical protein
MCGGLGQHRCIHRQLLQDGPLRAVAVQKKTDKFIRILAQQIAIAATQQILIHT